MFAQPMAEDSGPDDSFGVRAAVQLPDGSLVVAYDPDAPTAGDETNLGSPRLVELTSDGTVTEFPLPVIDDRPLQASTTPLIADVVGTLYLYDGEGYLDRNGVARVVARDADGEWRVVHSLDGDTVVVEPRAAIGPDGDLYLATISSVLRFGPDGQPRTIAGATNVRSSDIDYPESPVRPEPLPATTVQLPRLTGLVVGDDGVVYLATEKQVLRIGLDGILSVLASIGKVGEVEPGQIAIPLDNPGEVSLFTELAMDADGSLLLADTGQQRLIRIGESSSEVLLTNISSVENGTIVGRPPSTDLLVYQGGGDVLCRYVG